ncbi:SDR family oxidoreductase [Actinomadura roseirufa]|uniref:SDR family oxidoreductase n=1 Tax=Actinomadura roseirufa TaxID=2094049 RepID=UPI001041856B
MSGRLRRIADAAPLKGLRRSGEMAGVVALLASDDASCTTGHEIIVNGGVPQSGTGCQDQTLWSVHGAAECAGGAMTSATAGPSGVEIWRR